MTITVVEAALYAGALFLLFITPGPVWVGLIARTLSGGFAAAWPLTLGVVVGDVLWSVLAILGMAWVAESFAGAMEVLTWVACGTFLLMGWLVLRSAGDQIDRDSRLTRPGLAAGFLAGLVVILANPKAILFYMGMLPGFFDLAALTTADIVAIVTLSAIVPLAGNLTMATFVVRARALLKSPQAVRRMNVAAGCLLIGVGLAIPFL
ncbi:MAG: putative threonine efflux protein [Rhodobacteraceae bacterium HLUCCA08]|nr:MAG: putative threonine efflux protein [Rhodobacteraceae bacterium HLUCCA08]